MKNLDERIIANALFEGRFPAAGLFCACRRRGGRSYAQKEQNATLPQDRSEAPGSSITQNPRYSTASVLLIQGETISLQWNSSLPGIVLSLDLP
jgi:hypothetical protein